MKIIYFYLSGNILQLHLNILQWSDKLMFALGVHVRPLSNILHPAGSLRAHRAVIAGPSRPVTPHLRGQPRPPAPEYRCGEKVQPVKNKLIKLWLRTEPLDERGKGPRLNWIDIRKPPSAPPHPPAPPAPLQMRL